MWRRNDYVLPNKKDATNSLAFCECLNSIRHDVSILNRCSNVFQFCLFCISEYCALLWVQVWNWNFHEYMMYVCICAIKLFSKTVDTTCFRSDLLDRKNLSNVFNHRCESFCLSTLWPVRDALGSMCFTVYIVMPQRHVPSLLQHTHTHISKSLPNVLRSVFSPMKRECNVKKTPVWEKRYINGYLLDGHVCGDKRSFASLRFVFCVLVGDMNVCIMHLYCVCMLRRSLVALAWRCISCASSTATHTPHTRSRAHNRTSQIIYLSVLVCVFAAAATQR